jgi:3-oxoacyl-[acyl-carrier-protein] synthase-3
MFNAKITGTGLYHPEMLVTNEDFMKIAGDAITAEIMENVEKKIGIKQRYWTGPDQSTADMAAFAGEKAIKDAGLKPEDIEMVVVATDTPEFITPPTACVVQGRLGCVKAGAFDINGACSGFVAAVNVVSRSVKTGYKNALVIGVYNMQKWVDIKSMPVWGAMLADGAGALVISQTEEEGGFIDSHMYADGTMWNFMGIFGGGTKYPINPEMVAKGEHKLRILENLSANANIEHWPRLVRELCGKCGIRPADVSHFLFTQVNKKTIEAVMGILELPVERTTMVMDKYGYTGSACVPMALDTALKAGKIKKGDYVILLASGVGIAMATALYKW